MQTLTEQLLDEALNNRILTDVQLARLIPGTNQRRYNLVNRAMKAGELIRLRRGLYMLAEKYRGQPCHPFALAQNLVPGSYVSLETALAFHGWIPEAVYTTASILPGKKSADFKLEPFGRFTFHPLAVQTGAFLELVERQQLDQQAALVASPLRSLLDIVCLRKIEWQGLPWLLQGMRIDEAQLNAVTSSQLQTLLYVYKYKRVHAFIVGLAAALVLELNHD